ncbi:MAG TPA: DUF1328 domain-containing protein [Longimicrobiales bacterium]|nr:DUF1328 domain-containing protein [Longimicrobiales bacterium]
MLQIAFIALVIALVAAMLGFGGLASGAAQVARLAFGIFLAIAILAFASALFTGALLF